MWERSGETQPISAHFAVHLGSMDGPPLVAQFGHHRGLVCGRAGGVSGLPIERVVYAVSSDMGNK
eukprot:2502579-Lingulodinium_polyedra.AAC.1